MSKILLASLLTLVPLPLTAQGMDAKRETARRGQVTQPAVLGSKTAYRRPPVTSTLRTSGLSTAERIALKPKHTVAKPESTRYWKGLQRNVVIVKFADGARVREEHVDPEARMRTDNATLAARLAALRAQQDQLDDYDRELLRRRGLQPQGLGRQMNEVRRILTDPRLKDWRRLFEIDDDTLAKLRLNAEIKTKRQSSDLANYYAFELEESAEGERLADALNRLDIVEIAYLAPIPEDADVPPPTPSFQGSQGYLNAAPAGIDAKFAWTVPGGKGGLVKIIDVEGGWNLNHEDLPSVFFNDGRIDTGDSRQHGTAVLGVLLALDDGIGVTGIVPEASGGVVSIHRGIAYKQNVADSVLLAALQLAAGDVILIEQHSRGPGNDGDCTACINDDGKPREQCGYIAMEYWDDIFDAVNAATAAGIIVVEAAGNGEMNLDHSRYDDRFDRTVRNSGAIVVGGGQSATHKPECWSNHGSRVDLQGWGENVMTTGYGEPDSLRINGFDDNQWYRSGFNGTSSATPIVAGAVAAIQGIQIANNNPVLDWFEMADLLVKTGTPQTGGKHIGPLPNLRAAIATLSPPTKAGATFQTTVQLLAPLLDADRVSGFSGARTRVLGANDALGAIERLAFGERSDNPCFVRVEKAGIVDHTSVSPDAELDLCGKKGSTDRSLELVPLLATGHDTFVRGVSVCNSNTGNSTRLKGVKTYLVRVEDDGSLSMISNPQTMERPNCDENWRAPAMCPAGSVATKLIVHIRPDHDDEVVTGLSLQCREVEATRTCVSGC